MKQVHLVVTLDSVFSDTDVCKDIILQSLQEYRKKCVVLGHLKRADEVTFVFNGLEFIK